jgi:S-adenosylmethionine uptake transporter
LSNISLDKAGANVGSVNAGSLNKGILIAFTAFASYALGDTLIKLASRGTDTFTIAFFVTMFSFIPVIFARPAEERWTKMFRMRHPGLTLLRAAAGVGAGMCGFYAFSKLPLSEAYTLLFMMPFFLTVLSVIFLKEKTGWRRWTALAVGMAGVVIVIQPGFRTIIPAHFAALGAGMCGAVAMVIIRHIGGSEKRTSLMGVSLTAALVANGLVLAIKGFQWPSQEIMLMLAATGLFHGSATLMLVIASQMVPANRIAPLQYTQLIWGVVLGAVFFAEYPNTLGYAGLVLVAASGLATFIREDARGVWPQNFRDIRNRFG